MSRRPVAAKVCQRAKSTKKEKKTNKQTNKQTNKHRLTMEFCIRNTNPEAESAPG